ncbi:MAG: T9SS type A sorting domain-containing protein, partial [bacterium]|nr:T9SS type A sorting domain-containing protein [bacterium]
YICPPVLFWDDAESETRGTDEEWDGAFENLGLILGVHYDKYYAMAPTSSIGSGLGRRASTNQLGWYNELLYSTGSMTTTTICNGDWDDGGSDDITRLENWLDLGDKDMFLTGNGLAFDLNGSGASTVAFLTNRMGLTFNAQTHRDLLGGQLAPRVLAVAGNPVLSTIDSWIAFGGCPQLFDFDLVTPSGSTRLAEFANASGTPGGYPYSALTLNSLGSGSRVVTLTSDLAYVETDANEGAKANATQSARVRILKDVLGYFGVSDNIGLASGVTPFAGKFALENAPNPFNPITEISYTIKAPGHMTLKIFNVRGELVKTLINGHVEADGVVEWDGTNGQGGKVSSGVYFYQAKMEGDVQVSKMALVK